MGAYQSPGNGGSPLLLTASPASLRYCPSSANVFSVIATGPGLTYAWQVNRNDGLGFVTLQDDAMQIGSQTANLQIQNPAPTMNQYQYRCAIGDSDGCNALSAAATLTVESTILYVNASSPGGDGSGWGSAYQSFAQAVADPKSALCGAQIWVAAGTYSVNSVILSQPVADLWRLCRHGDESCPKKRHGQSRFVERSGSWNRDLRHRAKCHP